MAHVDTSGHCLKSQHMKTCAFCFFLCIFLNPLLVYSDVRTTLPTTTQGNDHNEQKGQTRLSFVELIFAKYGQNGTMTYEAFEHLLYSLGMVKSIKPDNHVINHDLTAHILNGKFQNIHDHDGADQNHDLHDSEAADYFGDIFGSDYDQSDHSENLENVKDDTHEHGNHDHSHHSPHKSHEHQPRPDTAASSNPESNHQLHCDSHHVPNEPSRSSRSLSTRSRRSTPNCMTALDILQTLNMSNSQLITEKDFVRLCPILIYQIDKHTCEVKNHEGHDHGHTSHGNQTDDSFKLLNAPLIVWGYALLSVFIISLVGLLGVAIVPIMQKVFYNHLLQFLVALAVGSLTGDALLHLLPHSLQPHDDHGHGDHHGGHSKIGIYKGLVAFAGVYFFFLTERIMGLVTEWRRRVNRRKVKKVAQANSSPKLLREMSDQETDVGFRLTQRGDGNCEERMMMVHPSKDLRNMAEDMHEHIHRDCGKDDNKRISHSHGGAGHNHGHGHSHDVPDSVASVAWMVIMGDGLHNFSDGLAIGAAFANSLTGGLSTSVAVFCHELPHELGDFAMLLRAGMTVRQALVYNCVSSILCLVGMIVGVAAGNMESVSLWIFALAGGMFIYIALVDMLPEMINNSPKHGESPVWHLILQNVGILMGSGIMLVIALYEDKIRVPEVFP